MMLLLDTIKEEAKRQLDVYLDGEMPTTDLIKVLLALTKQDDELSEQAGELETILELI